jgi:ribose 5-phosphate isomerase A
MTIYERAVSLIKDGDKVGLGSGRASMAFIKLLGERVKASPGLKITGVPTSVVSEELARSLGIPLVELADAMPLDLTVDGADEVGPGLALIKGWGRALIREKVVAAGSNRLVILAGKDKLVKHLGERGKLPVEVVPFALDLCKAKLSALGLNPVLWQEGGHVAETDNGNYILDCMVTAPITDPAATELQIQAIPGVVGTGFFLKMASLVLVGDQDRNFELLQECTA